MIEIGSRMRNQPAPAHVVFEALVDFERPGGGTDLRWTLFVQEPAPGEELVGHLRKRMNQLINAELRYSFGQ